MKLGIIADIHANLAAMEAVLAALDREGCIKILCLGDITGYGPFPVECVARIRGDRIPTVLGNHDEWATHEQVVLGIGNDVRSVLAWTRRLLDPEAKAWLADLPLSMTYAGVHLVHASNQQGRNVWPYVRDLARLRRNFDSQEHAICFSAHTHHPAVGVERQDGTHEFLDLEPEMILPAYCRVLVNPGSVGQPRDGDPRAAAVIFETRDRSLRFLRVPYDVAATQTAMRERELPERFIERLADGH